VISAGDRTLHVAWHIKRNLFSLLIVLPASQNYRRRGMRRTPTPSGAHQGRFQVKTKDRVRRAIRVGKYFPAAQSGSTFGSSDRDLVDVPPEREHAPT
jgi:hypothetical protein